MADGFILRHCPATSNLPTAMSRGAWESLCKSTMKRELDDMKTRTGDKLIKPLCSICKGETLPPKLTIIDLKMENDMAARGTCEACEERNVELRPRGDRQLCGKCRTIFSNAANWLPVVEMALADIYPEKYGPAAAVEFGAETVKAAVDEKTEAVLKRIAAAVGYDGNDPDELAGMVESMQSSLYFPSDDMERALELLEDNDYVSGAPAHLLAERHAIHTAALLDSAEIELAAARVALEDERRNAGDVGKTVLNLLDEIAGLNAAVETLREDRESLVGQRDDMETRLKHVTGLCEAYHDELQKLRGSTVVPCELVTTPAIPSNHLLDLATTFLANPNAGCEEVAGWILSVKGEAD